MTKKKGVGVNFSTCAYTQFILFSLLCFVFVFLFVCFLLIGIYQKSK